MGREEYKLSAHSFWAGELLTLEIEAVRVVLAFDVEGKATEVVLESIDPNTGFELQ